MADDNARFGIEVSVDTKDATKKLDGLNKQAENIGKNFAKEHKININSEDFKGKVNDIEGSVKNLESSLGDVERKVSTAFDVGKLLIWYEVIKKVGQAAIGAANYVLDAAHAMTSLDNTAQGLSISTNTLKAWETTFKSMGFSANEADAALGSIQDRLTGQLLNPSTQVAAAFQTMGVNLRKANGEMRESDDVLAEILSKFKNFKPEYAVALGAQLGISRNLVMQAIKHPEYAQTLAKQINNPVVTESQIKSSRDTVKTQAIAGAEIEKVKNDALEPLNNTLKNDILPPLTTIASALSLIAGPGVQHIVNATKSSISRSPLGLIGRGIGAAIKEAPYLGQDIANLPAYIKNLPHQARLNEAISAGTAMGMNSTELARMVKIIKAEDPKLNNGPSEVKGSTAYGLFQIKPETMRGLAKNNPGFNANDWSIPNQVLAQRLLSKEFAGVASKYGVNPNDDSQYRAFHNLGQGDYIKALKMKRDNPNTTYGDIYKATNLSDLKLRGNGGLVNQPFPSATENSNITNNLATHNTSSNISSSTHIGQVNVSANNPSEFANALANHKYLDRINSMSGRLA